MESCNSSQSGADLRPELFGDLATVLDMLPYGVIVFTPGGRIRYANYLAEDALTRMDGMLQSGSHISFTDPRTQYELRSWMASMGRASGSQAILGTRVLSIHRSHGLRPYTAKITMPAETLRGSEASTRPAEPNAVLLFADPEITHAPRCLELGILFGLSRRESEVAIRLWEGFTLASAADSLGISPNTAKTHLGRVFEKTGVSRQQELLQMMHQSLPPFLVERWHREARPLRKPAAVA